MLGEIVQATLRDPEVNETTFSILNRVEYPIAQADLDDVLVWTSPSTITEAELRRNHVFWNSFNSVAAQVAIRRQSNPIAGLLRTRAIDAFTRVFPLPRQRRWTRATLRRGDHVDGATEVARRDCPRLFEFEVDLHLSRLTQTVRSSSE